MEIAKLIQSALGVAFIVFLVWRLFPKPKPMTIERVQENFARCYSESKILSIYMDTEGQSAFIELFQPGSFGIARTLGDRVVCRLFQLSELSDLKVNHTKLTLHFKDFTLPKTTIQLSPEAILEVEKIISIHRDEVVNHAS